MVGGADDPAITADDFNVSLNLENGRLTGTAEGLIGVREECPDGPESCQPVAGKLPRVGISLPAEDFPEGACSDIGVCIVTDAQKVQGEVTANFIGTAVLSRASSPIS